MVKGISLPGVFIKTKNNKLRLPRNLVAVDAKLRTSAGPMRHRAQPKGGAKNVTQDLLDEASETSGETTPEDVIGCNNGDQEEGDDKETTRQEGVKKGVKEKGLKEEAKD